MITDINRPITISEELDVIDLLGISDILLDYKKVRFRARGWCMYPGSRNRDILEFVPTDIREIEIGDGCLFHNGTRLYCHKVAAKHLEGNSQYVITQQDGPQNPIYSYQIIGRLISIKRNGKICRYDPGLDLICNFKNQFNLYYRLDIFIRKSKKILANLIIELQCFKLYTLIARVIFKERYYLLGVVNKSQSFYKPLNYLGISKRKSDKIQSIINDSEEISAFHILAKIGNKAAGRLVINHYNRPEFPQAEWWLHQISVRIRYGGLGIETELMNEALRIAKILKIRKLFTIAREHNSFFIRFLTENSFRVVSSKDKEKEITVLALDLDSMKKNEKI